MVRSIFASLLILFGVSSTAYAQSCVGNPVAVQVLGSGAPGFVKDRANTSYLLWIGTQAKILVDAGGGAYVRFGQAGAKFSDLSMILVSHLHPDHVSDLPGVLWSGRMTRNDTPCRSSDRRATKRRRVFPPSSIAILTKRTARFRSWVRSWLRGLE